MSQAYDNPTFTATAEFPSNGVTSLSIDDQQHNNNKHHDRDQWGKGIEFLLSCIAMAVS